MHPLISDLGDLKDVDLQEKIAKLQQIYAQAARAQNQFLLMQVKMTMENYQAEQARRTAKNNETAQRLYGDAYSKLIKRS